MFQRVIYEDWQLLLPGIAFFIFFGIFLYICIRVTRMPRRRRERLADLPLEQEEERQVSAEKKPENEGKDPVRDNERNASGT